MADNLSSLLAEIRACRICEEHLPLGPNPVLVVPPESRIIIAGQAPGVKVHESGIPWNDPSGDRLREWLGMGREEFYGHPHLAIVPMGFCYPGKGKSGDMPPRPECTATWHQRLESSMPQARLVLAVGQYAIGWHLGKRKKKTLTETVRCWKEYLDLGIFPLPHPSPRNLLWLRRNPWFEEDVVPEMRLRFRAALED